MYNVCTPEYRYLRQIDVFVKGVYNEFAEQVKNYPYVIAQNTCVNISSFDCYGNRYYLVYSDFPWNPKFTTKYVLIPYKKE